jgi:hypothetical protein
LYAKQYKQPQSTLSRLPLLNSVGMPGRGRVATVGASCRLPAPACMQPPCVGAITASSTPEMLMRCTCAY